MDKVVITKEDTLAGKVIRLSEDSVAGSRLWTVCGKMGKTIHGNDGWLLQSLDLKELRVEPEWVVAHAPQA